MPTHIDFMLEQLAKPLDRKHVKERTQAGRSLSYVEGWHAIAEANRIFGFDGWTRETLEMKEVRPAELVKLKKQSRNGDYEVEQWRVGFCAKVRVIAQGIAREGYGFGSGFASDLGDAYESAIKEAETDAMKRALMTFGNPFGLALYDKTQANVADGVDEYEAPGEPPPPGEVVPSTRYEKHVTEGLSRVPSGSRPSGWEDAVAIMKDPADYAAIQIALDKPFMKNTISAWSNYWIRTFYDRNVIPKVAEFRGSEVALDLQARIHAKYPLERVPEAAE